ncbi:MAG: type I restriction enzyme HsdR N-terminal domain-containing protein [Chloroflexi bacterium]|nr:type I restriction enzyme HsdR N-terminal domain-containing protein [Chloroflexota bacterium]
MELIESVRKISFNVERQLDILRREDEEAIKQVSVTPFIEALGYDTRNLDEVKSQFAVGNDWVDYAIKHDRKPIILVEAKRATDTLSEKRWTQLYDYYCATEAKYAVLTNGIVFQFYTDLYKRDIMDKLPFLTLDMCDFRAGLVKRLEAFTKSGFDPERARLSAKRSALYRSVQKEFVNPSADLVTHFIKSITYSLPKEEDKVLLKEVFDNFIKDEIAKRLPVVGPETIRKDKVTIEPLPKLRSNDTTEIVEIPLYAEYEGKAFEATLLFNPLSKSGDQYLMKKTRIRFAGEVMAVNVAETKARKSIVPDAKESWKGWDRWKLHDPRTGELRAIRELLDDFTLRDQFLGDA